MEDLVEKKVARYRDVVQTLLADYAALKVSHGEIESQLVVDTIHNHYQVLRVGWQGQERIYSCAMHLDIKAGKIWIQHNATEVDLGQVLESMGVPKSDIVVGFHSQFMRQFTDYAVG